MSVHRWHAHLAERVATIDVQTTAGYKHPAESEQGERPRPSMAPVESADPHGESDVVALLTAIEFELLSRGLAGGQTSGGDQRCSRFGELGDRLGGTVDCEHVAGRTDAGGDLASRSTRAAADLDHTEAGLERQRIDDRAQSR